MTSTDQLDIHGERWTIQYVTGHVQPSNGGALFLKDKSGQEHSVTAAEMQLPARDGHLITMGYAVGSDGTRWPLIAANHNTGDTYVRKDVVQQQICGQLRMQKNIARKFLIVLVAGGAIIGYLSDNTFPVGNAIMGGLVGLMFGWLGGIIVSGLGAAKTSYDRMNAFLNGPELADIKTRIAKEKY